MNNTCHKEPKPDSISFPEFPPSQCLVEARDVFRGQGKSSVCLSVCLSVHLCLCVCCISVCVWPSVGLYVCLTVCLSVPYLPPSLVSRQTWNSWNSALARVLQLQTGPSQNMISVGSKVGVMSPPSHTVGTAVALVFSMGGLSFGFYHKWALLMFF